MPLMFITANSFTKQLYLFTIKKKSSKKVD